MPCRPGHARSPDCVGQYRTAMSLRIEPSATRLRTSSTSHAPPGRRSSPRRRAPARPRPRRSEVLAEPDSLLRISVLAVGVAVGPIVLLERSGCHLELPLEGRHVADVGAAGTRGCSDASPTAKIALSGPAGSLNQRYCGRWCPGTRRRGCAEAGLVMLAQLLCAGAAQERSSSSASMTPSRWHCASYSA